MKQTTFYRKSEEFFDYVIAKYAVGVRFVLRHQTMTLLVTLGTFLLTVYLFLIVPKGFFPQQDTGVHVRQYRRGPGRVGSRRWRRMQDRVARIVLAGSLPWTPIGSFVGGGGGGFRPVNNGRLFSSRSSHSAVRKGARGMRFIARLRRKLAEVHGHHPVPAGRSRTSASVVGVQSRRSTNTHYSRRDCWTRSITGLRGWWNQLQKSLDIGRCEPAICNCADCQANVRHRS